MKEINSRRNSPWWRSKIIKKSRDYTWIWKKTLSFGNDIYTVDKDPYDWCLRQSKWLIAIDAHITKEMRNHKLLTKLPGYLEHAVKCRFSKESTFDEISTTLPEVRIRTSIGRYNSHITGDNRENQTLEEKETHDSESDITTGSHYCESPNHYAENFPKDREDIFQREKDTRKDQEGHSSDSDSVGNGCEPNPNVEYFVGSKNHGAKEIGSVHLKRRKPMTKNLDGLKHQPPDKEGMTTKTLLAQDHMNHTSTSKKT
ncbi:hypothetical protein O181_083836 [Austropuccinia psidii MF-1]|uniref:Uncharacterized protein n=1 Tax=Austropuccinia psidii MF-1 TaxID=1389203 RepID=A0A9Q3II88_9BASI|nr:hypothetical protein [Austropuccinia psidii MF-1]